MIKEGSEFYQEFQITPAIYKGFISLFCDKNPLHTDRNFAKGKGFLDRVMHGNILGGYLSFFIGECLPIKNVIIHSQEINYKRPVYLDQPLMLYAKVNEIFESVNTIEFKYNFSDRNEGVVVANGKFKIVII